MTNDFKKELNHLDWSTQSLHYKPLFAEGEVMKTLQEIIDFSLPLFQNQLKEGKKIAQFVEEHLKVCPVGIVPMRLSEGYVLINCSGSKQVEVYHYQISIFDEADAQFPSVNLQWTDTYETAIVNTFEKIKQDLISKRKELPNPATYSITSDMQFPMAETLLPIAKMSLSKHLTQTIH